MPEQVLIIDPPTELRFQGPFTSQVTSFLKLYNPIDKKVFFKIKTTAPKKYCVRPNSGALEPKKTVDVAVSLQPFDYDPQEKNKHKFMVQSIIAPDGEATVDNIWANARAQDSMDSKLKCVFEMPADNAAASEDLATGDEGRKSVSQSKPAAKPVIDSTTDVAKEVKNLRMEESMMRQENMALKEEIVRLQKVTQSSPMSRPAPQVLQEMPQGRTMFDVVIVIVIALIGIILGKFFL